MMVNDLLCGGSPEQPFSQDMPVQIGLEGSDMSATYIPLVSRGFAQMSFISCCLPGLPIR